YGALVVQRRGISTLFLMTVDPAMLSLRQLITEVAQELFAPGNPGLILYPLRDEPIHHPKDAASLRRGSDNDLSGDGRGTEDATHFRHLFDDVQDIERIKAFGKKNEEAVPG